MKKFLAILLAALMLFTMAACRGSDETSADAGTAENTEATADEGAADAAGADAAGAEATEADASAASDDFKVGIITGTVSQGEEEFQAAQKMIEKYGAEKIITATYPDKFNDEVETTIAQVVSLADQGAKAIVFCQAVPGTIAAIEKVHETYPDVLFVTGVVQEAPAEE